MNLAMEAMRELDEEIIQRLPQLNEKQKEAVLSVVKNFATGQQDWWDEISDEQKDAIDKALEEMNEGKLTPHDEVMAKSKKWMKQ